MKRLVPTISTGLGAMLGLTVLAHAQTAPSAEFQVRLEVQPECTIDVPDLTLDSTSEGGGEFSATGSTTITVSCTGATGYTLGLSDGIHSEDGVRRLQAGAGAAARYVTYTLTKDIDGTEPWDDDANALVVTADDYDPEDEADFPVYATVAPQALSAGVYLDAVTATITYEPIDSNEP